MPTRTYGGKSSRAEFADVRAAALNGAGLNSVGIGTTLAAVSQQFTQGNISTTDNPAWTSPSMAVGFFQVTDGVNPTRYTRNGQFKINREGFIVNNDALKLMGYRLTAPASSSPAPRSPCSRPRPVSHRR